MLPWEARRGERDGAEDQAAELRAISDAAVERNAREPVLLDLRGISDAADWFLIASGDSDVHARAIADNILEALDGAGARPAGIEGRSSGHWILIDCIDIVVHIFLPRVRDFYRLEQLWGDAPRFELE